MVTKEYVSRRCFQWGLESNVKDCHRALVRAEKELESAMRDTDCAEDALGILIEIGPEGLFRMESPTEQHDGYSIGQIIAAYKREIKSTAIVPLKVEKE